MGDVAMTPEKLAELEALAKKADFAKGKTLTEFISDNQKFRDAMPPDVAVLMTDEIKALREQNRVMRESLIELLEVSTNPLHRPATKRDAENKARAALNKE